LVLKLESVSGPWQKDVAALLATLAAITGTAMSSGNFEGRWRAARHALETVQQLRIELLDPDVNLKEANAKLRQAMATYDSNVGGAEGSASN
jgi:hypothetical protein